MTLFSKPTINAGVLESDCLIFERTLDVLSKDKPTLWVQDFSS